MSKLTAEQKMQIYCVKHGHAKYIQICFGQVTCGRCGDVIGDRLLSSFDTTNYIIVGHGCETCNSLKNKLNKMDKKILEELEKGAKPK